MKFIEKVFNKIFKKNFEKKIFMIGCSHFSQMRNNYYKVKNISEVEYKIFSQNGEDGIIDYLLFCLDIKKPKFVEIGVGDYSESNTRFLFERLGCKGLIVDSIQDLNKKVSQNVKLWKGDLTVLETYINSKNIIKILFDNKFDKNLDLFSLDIDGIDYWIIKQLPKNFAKIAIIEFNANFCPDLEVTVPDSNIFDRSKYHYSHLCFGASIKAIIKLMMKKNFVFLGTNLLCCNAFFVSKEFFSKINLPLPDINNLSENTNSLIRESRSTSGNLNYLSGDKRFKEIENCEVIDLSDDKNNLVKLKHLT